MWPKRRDWGWSILTEREPRTFQAQEPLASQVVAAQARLLHDQVPQSLTGGIGVALVSSVLIYAQVPFLWLALWWLLYLLTFAFRLFSYLRIKPFLNTEDKAVAWAKFSRLPLFISGLYWGLSAGFAVYSGDLLVAAITITLVAGLSSGAAGALSAIHACYLAYAIPMTLPPLFALLLVGGFEAYALAFLTSLFMLANAVFSRSIYRGMTTMILTRLENESLIRSMATQQEALLAKTEEAEKNAEIAEEANRAKSVFLAAASHDLAQPLHSMRLFLLALKEEKEAPMQRELISKALQCGDSLSDLFMALLDISKLDAGDVVVNEQVFDMAEVIDSLAEEFAVQQTDFGVSFCVSSVSCLVKSDATILRRILRNLLSNAFKYAPRGSVSLNCKIEEDSLLVEIQDTGIGIAEDQLEAVFKEFYQVGNVERDRSKGLGLGLAIVDRLSALLKLTIEIDSEPDKGTTVALRLPISHNPVVANAAKVPVTESEVTYKHQNVVFIDDERETREAMQQVLEQSGFKLYVAENVQVAMQFLHADNIVPDLVISDYRLQAGTTGVEAILQLREEFNINIPALIISGDSQLSSLKDISDNEIGFLHKLSPHQELEQTILDLLAK